MTPQDKRRRSAESSRYSADDALAPDISLPQPAERQVCREDRAESEIVLRNALSRHLHDLLNALWPVSVRIELSISDETCPPQFRGTLEELGRCVEEAMTIASQASMLVGPPTDTRLSS